MKPAFGPVMKACELCREMNQKPLHFVQRGRILLRCGSALALSLPSLGVSSLDLGRVPTPAALLSWRGHFLFSWRDHLPARHSGWSEGQTSDAQLRIEARNFVAPRNEKRIIPRPPEMVRARRAERRTGLRPTRRNRWPPEQILCCVRAAAHPCRSPG